MVVMREDYIKTFGREVFSYLILYIDLGIHVQVTWGVWRLKYQINMSYETWLYIFTNQPLETCCILVIFAFNLLKSLLPSKVLIFHYFVYLSISWHFSIYHFQFSVHRKPEKWQNTFLNCIAIAILFSMK